MRKAYQTPFLVQLYNIELRKVFLGEQEDCGLWKKDTNYDKN